MQNIIVHSGSMLSLKFLYMAPQNKMDLGTFCRLAFTNAYASRDIITF
jgi:hypothetical protein